MSSVVPPSHAEQGKTVRIPFTTLNAGVPFTPTVFNTSKIVALVGPTDVISIAPTATDEVGKYFVDWEISANQDAGYYSLQIDADGVFTTDISFEVKAAGAYTPSVQESSPSVQTRFGQLTVKRDIENFCAMIRTILRDHPQLNRLTSGRETSDGEIRIATELAVSQYNGVPPLIGEATFGTFPSLAYLALGTIGWVLQSSFLLRLRNNLQYSDGGVSIDTENVAGYAQAAQNFYKAAYDAWIPEYKKAENLNRAFGHSPTGVHSEYFMLAAMLGDSSYGGSGVLLQ